jgi:hypothetical protein
VPSEEEIFGGYEEEEVEDEPFYFHSSVRFIEGILPTSDYAQQMINRMPYKLREATEVLLYSVFDKLVKLNSDNGMDMISKLIQESINHIKSAKGDTGAPMYIFGSYINSHLRMLRDEVRAELEFYARYGYHRSYYA